MLCSLFIGAVSACSFIIWKIEKWSLLKQTLVHFAVLAVPYFGIGYILNWLPHHLYGALSYALGFIFVYVVIWFSIYFSMKFKINKMNKHLKDMQQENINN